jgi:salicylate hydroxylase
MNREFGSPVWDLHRADMQTAMFQKAKEMGVKFRFGAPMEKVVCEKPEIVLKVR